MQTTTIPVTAAGANGSATGNTTSQPVSGILLGIYIDIASQPNTTDVTISTPSAPIKTILTITNISASAWYYPRAATHDPTGTALTDYTPLPIDDNVKVAVAGGNAGLLTVYLLWAEA